MGREPRRPTKGIIGVCALESKARSKPARNIFGKLVSSCEADLEGFAHDLRDTLLGSSHAREHRHAIDDDRDGASRP